MNAQERLAILETKLTALEIRINKIDEERSWIVKLVGGLVISAVVALVLNRGGA